MTPQLKLLYLLAALTVITIWLIRFVSVPQGYLTIATIPAPPTRIEDLQIPTIPFLTYIDILSLAFGFTGIYIIPRLRAHIIEQLHLFDILGISCDAISIYLALWGAWLIGAP